MREAFVTRNIPNSARISSKRGGTANHTCQPLLAPAFSGCQLWQERQMWRNLLVASHLTHMTIHDHASRHLDLCSKPPFQCKETEDQRCRQPKKTEKKTRQRKHGNKSRGEIISLYSLSYSNETLISLKFSPTPMLLPHLIAQPWATLKKFREVALLKEKKTLLLAQGKSTQKLSMLIFTEAQRDKKTRCTMWLAFHAHL